MGLMDKIMDKVMEKAQGGGGGGGYSEQPSQSYGGGDSGYSSGPPPGDLPYPWVSRYDPNSGRTYYVNEQTSETSWEHPGSSGGGGGGGYGGGGYGGGYGESSGYAPQEQEQKKDHSMLYGAGGAALGLAGGALAMHEGEKIHDGWEDKKDDIQEGVQDFPENAAHWTGEKVGEAEEIPDNIEEGWDRFGDKVENSWDSTVDNVEDAPENVAEWTGEKVGAVESFGSDIGDAYDEGEAEGRGDDDW
ncbi:WW domain-containing protein [Aspergillus glaucus CBS 516.65]|uniref:WW domain-containing protein n=1 Tax=Aspergillus glaucus CBS 516.65 TaxID=1160497 RepID=A0A1L9V6W0_ASPGL|nr:hypothetical protein ASPGLDRAFT_77477 [Aspergillus glaucus CBS 516.65]OJJ79609.1 hypothetical protein ASPGLDRAFT_77477 [Aspergillus glaucus CBS 516.65]